MHARAANRAATPTGSDLSLFDQLELLLPTPWSRWNRAVAVAKVEGEAAALAIVDTSRRRGAHRTPLAPRGARRLARRLGAFDDAEKSYLRALNS